VSADVLLTGLKVLKGSEMRIEVVLSFLVIPSSTYYDTKKLDDGLTLHKMNNAAHRGFGRFKKLVYVDCAIVIL